MKDAIITSIIIIGIVSLIIGGFAATKFESIAKMKGHEGYFWWCFWLGAIGWAMVIALPDRKSTLGQSTVGDYEKAENNDVLPEL